MPGKGNDIISLASFRYLEWRYVATAVYMVFRENEHNFATTACDTPADADVWIHVKRLRRHIHARARVHWCDLTGRNDTWFPFSVDGVCRIYLRIRKHSPNAITKFGVDLGPLKQIPEKKRSKKKRGQEEPDDAS